MSLLIFKIGKGCLIDNRVLPVINQAREVVDLGIDDEVQEAETRMDKSIEQNLKATRVLVPVLLALVLGLWLFAGR